MDNSRLLGSTERLYYRMRQHGGMNLVGFFHGKTILGDREKGLNIARLTSALNQLYLSSPLLQSNIRNNNNSLNFVRLNNPELPIKFVEQATSEQFENIVEQALKKRYEDNQCLWQLIVIQYKNDQAKFSLITAFDHILSDGIGMCYFVNSLMQIYENLKTEKNGDFTKKSDLTRFEPDIESLTNYKLKLKDYFYLIPDEILKNISPPIQPAYVKKTIFEHRTTKFVSYRLNKQTTRDLLQAARAQGTTVHGIIVAAMLFSIAKLKWAEKSIKRKNSNIKPLKISAVNPVNLRKYYNIPNEQIGSYGSALINQYKLTNNSEFWSFATNVREDVLRGIKKNKHISAALVYEGLQKIMSDRLIIELMNGKQQGRTETLTVSNIGKLTMDGKYGDIELTDIGFGAGIHGLGPSYFLAPLTFRDQLSFTLYYVDPLLSKEHAETICQELIKLLRYCLNHSSITLRQFRSM